MAATAFFLCATTQLPREKRRRRLPPRRFLPGLRRSLARDGSLLATTSIMPVLHVLVKILLLPSLLFGRCRRVHDEVFLTTAHAAGSAPPGGRAPSWTTTDWLRRRRLPRDDGAGHDRAAAPVPVRGARDDRTNAPLKLAAAGGRVGRPHDIAEALVFSALRSVGAGRRPPRPGALHTPEPALPLRWTRQRRCAATASFASSAAARSATTLRMPRHAGKPRQLAAPVHLGAGASLVRVAVWLPSRCYCICTMYQVLDERKKKKKKKETARIPADQICIFCLMPDGEPHVF